MYKRTVNKENIHILVALGYVADKWPLNQTSLGASTWQKAIISILTVNGPMLRIMLELLWAV